MFWSQWFWPQTYSIRVPCVYNRQQAWVSAVFSGLYIYVIYMHVLPKALCVYACASPFWRWLYMITRYLRLWHTPPERQFGDPQLQHTCWVRVNSRKAQRWAFHLHRSLLQETQRNKQAKKRTRQERQANATWFFSVFCSILCYYCWTSCMVIGLSGLLLAPHEWLNPPPSNRCFLWAAMAAAESEPGSAKTRTGWAGEASFNGF